jgi:integrase
LTVIEQKQQEQPQRFYLVTADLKSPYTKSGYRSTFNNFLSVIFDIPNQVNLYQEEQYLRTLLDYRPNVIESKIIDYIEYLKKRKLECSTIQAYCASVFHFFEINDINLNTRKIKRFFPQDESENISKDRPYSVNEIEQILAKCDIRSRVAILIMASTGMRINGLRELRYGDIRKIDEYNLYLIWVYSHSKSHRYYTFCTPECAVAVDAYLAYRRKFGEKLEDKSPLIREQFNIDNPFTVNVPRFLSPRMTSFIFEDLIKRSGVNQKRDVMRSHGFRKFVITTMDKAGLKDTHRRYLTGHAQVGQDRSYVKLNEEDLLSEYVKAIPLLSIDPTQRLKQENQDLKTVQSQRIERLEERLNDTERLLDTWRKVANDNRELRT